ncbi:hypothetical protein BX616_008216 [Lobosporangium transversale]|uniref:BUD22-domain-containing protein n=1 Tax=Lobosporangium transversale TaxID=64571 RepID=A0A1Y2GFJ9_9FUNG|nr:BUD22-domain-containing protein [Lobosporangium transversale]KAF9918515.1 hypothetical protein BX616_008216 [Lobosporangium transversale]ORZ09409.1 BUD22-domain-containing protein [Lobosporangium transversale]|eukprot:XP_021878862.1 BUD22-domain-containing protein [Lobosporangium transversale]
MTNIKADHKSGKKKENLNWEISKLQAQIGETTLRRAQKAIEAERKKENASTSTTARTGSGSGTGTGTGTTTATTPEEGSEEAKAIAEKLLKLKEVKISQKIYQAKKEIRRAFVKAKSFEIQRLHKRLKEARKAIESKSESNGHKEESPEETKQSKKKELTKDDIPKFEQELELVKNMNMDSLSEHAFVAKLKKHPILGSHALMKPYIEIEDANISSKVEKNQQSEKPKTDSLENNNSTMKESLVQIIEARLTNTKTVKEHMTKLWDELEHIATGKRVDHNELAKKRKMGIDGNTDNTEAEKSKKARTSKDIKEYRHKSNDSDEDGDESDNESVDMSHISDGEHNDGYDSDGLPLPMNGKATTATSMFIGSLNAGDSKKKKKDKKDKNDWVDDKFDEIYGKTKKNRPGQRARRLKAERKYGKEANHVKKAEEEARLREERKAARKAKKEQFKAKDASSANAKKLANRRAIGDGSVAKPITQTPSGPDLNDPTLHPSWIAKQTEKAAMAAALSGSKSNKIVFDDSD